MTSSSPRSAASPATARAHLIIDNVGASVLGENIAAARVTGRIVQVGRLGGRHAEIDLDELARKRLTLVGVTFRTRGRTRAQK